MAPSVGQRISVCWRGRWCDGTISALAWECNNRGPPSARATVEYDDGETWLHHLPTTKHVLGPAVATQATPAADKRSIADVTDPCTLSAKRSKLEQVAEPSAATQRPRRGSMSSLLLASLAPPSAAAPARRPLRAPRRRLLSIAFVWPEDTAWDRRSGVKGRRSPRWYADCVTEMIQWHGRDGASSFVVHVHGALGSAVIAALEERWSRALALSCGGVDERVTVAACARELHPMFPVAARAIPLLDSSCERLVLCLDVHDHLQQQSDSIAALLRQMSSEGTAAGFTCWAGHGLRDSFGRDDQTLPPPPLITADRTQAQAEAGVVWHLDCGLLLTLPAFRRSLAAIGAATYEAHLHAAHATYDWDDARGSDEMALELLLLAGEAASDGRHAADLARLCVRDASLRVHTLCADHSRGRAGGVAGGVAPGWAATWPATLEQAAPRYPPVPVRVRQFVYDEEVKRKRLRAGQGDDKLALRWAALQ